VRPFALIAGNAEKLKIFLVVSSAASNGGYVVNVIDIAAARATVSVVSALPFLISKLCGYVLRGMGA